MFTLRLLGGASLAEDGRAIRGRAAQPRRLALLALLSRAPGRTLSRDKLVGYLWAEHDGEQARHLLTVSLYELRKALGDEALSSRSEEVALHPELVRTDAEEFERALASGDPERAAAAYTGPFLDGFYVSGAPEFERWAAETREYLERRYREAVERMAEARTAAGDARGAVEAWRSLAVSDPYSARVALGYMRALDTAGDRAAALQHARVHAALVEAEYGMDPDPDVEALATRLRMATESPTVEAPATAEPTPDPLVREIDPEPPAPSPVPSPSAPEEPASSATISIPHGDPAEVRAPPRRLPAAPRRYARGAGALALVITAVSLMWTYRGPTPAESSPTTPPSIVVLPFVSIGGTGGDEYFRDGLTDEIINSLARVEGMRVISRTSSFLLRDRPMDAREIGKAVGVGNVLEGSVRVQGDSLRIFASLVDAKSLALVWSETYDGGFEDVFRVQNEIAERIVEALRVRLVGSPRAPVRAATTDVEAYHLYLRARHHWHRRTREDMARAVSLYQEAIEHDPQYALAYAGLADVYNTLAAFDYGLMPPAQAYPLAEAAARQALRLDPGLAQAHAALGNTVMNYRWNCSLAEQHYLRAIQLNPGYAESHHWYSICLLATGRAQESLAQIRLARELDPLSANLSGSLARNFYFRRDYPQALREYRRTLEMDPSHVLAHLGAGLAYDRLGDPERALEQYRGAGAVLGSGHPLVLALTARAYWALGQRAEAREIAGRLERIAGSAYVAPEYFLALYLGLEDHDRALAALRRAYDSRSGSMIYLDLDPLLDPLRSDARFVALQRSVRAAAGRL
jgi:TolB-like protein/DNA-binding SARP family transcriptional activator/tetratricopeptide (TPR) repeat protein